MRWLKLFLVPSLVTFSTLGRSETSVAYWDFGPKGAEALVLIHGFNDSHKTWEKLVPELAKRYRVIIYDQPGHGQSIAEGKDFSPKYMASVLNHLLDSLQIPSAYIVGHSMGGRTALEFASKYPARTKAVLVEDMSALSSPEAVAALPEALEKFDRVKQNVPNTFSDYLSASWTLSKYYNPTETAWILGASEMLQDGSVKLGNRPEVTALYLYEGLAQDMNYELKTIHAPLMFFAADPASGTAVLQGDAIQHIQNVRPDVKIKVFRRASHTIHKRPKFLPALLNFLIGNDRGQSQSCISSMTAVRISP